MIGLDTNVLVRYLAQDDPKQSPIATRLMESLTIEEPGFVTVVSIVELTWVLSGCYGCTKSELCEVLETLMQTKAVVIQQADVVWQAIRLFRDSKADFPDCLIERAARDAGCRYTTTFDRAAAKSTGMKLIE